MQTAKACDGFEPYIVINDLCRDLGFMLACETKFDKGDLYGIITEISRKISDAYNRYRAALDDIESLPFPD